MASESMLFTNGYSNFYKSDKVLGKLYRSIQLSNISELSTEKYNYIVTHDCITTAILDLDLPINLQYPLTDEMNDFVNRFFGMYLPELQSIMYINSISFDKPLSESEFFIGIIIE